MTGPSVNPVRSPFADINPPTLCKIGQETVGEIIHRMQVIFDSLKHILVKFLFSVFILLILGLASEWFDARGKRRPKPKSDLPRKPQTCYNPDATLTTDLPDL